MNFIPFDRSQMLCLHLTALFWIEQLIAFEYEIINYFNELVNYFYNKYQLLHHIINIIYQLSEIKV